MKKVFVIQNIESGLYWAAGTPLYWTDKIKQAFFFETTEEAEQFTLTANGDWYYTIVPVYKQL